MFFTPKYFLYADGAEHIAKLANARTTELVRMVEELLRMNQALRYVVTWKDRIDLEDAKLLGERLVLERRIAEYLRGDEA